MLKQKRLRITALAVTVLVTASACNETMTVDQGNSYTSSPTTTISGAVTPPEDRHSRLVSVTVNGADATVDGERYTAEVPLDGEQILNRVLVTSKWSDKSVLNERRTVVYGDGTHGRVVPKATVMAKGSGLRINDTGLNNLVDEIKQKTPIDVGALAPKGKIMYEGSSWPYPRAKIDQAPSIASWDLAVDPQPGKVNGKITLRDLNLRLYLETWPINAWWECGYMKIHADSITIDGDYRLAPLASDRTKLDVNQSGDPTISMSGFSWQWDGGVCDVFQGIVNGFLPNMQNTLTSGLKSATADPDGAGPQDSAVAAAIQSALANVNVAGPLGNALGVTMNSNIGGVTVDDTGVSIQADTSFVADAAAPGAPALSSIVTYDDSLPALPARSTKGFAYDVAVGLSASSFNQLLSTQTEKGLFDATITSFGGQPLTLRRLVEAADVNLGPLVPEQANFPLKIVLAPEVAPIIEKGPGSGTSLANLRVSGYRVKVVRADNDGLLMDMVIDFTSKLDFTVSNGALRILLAPPTPDALRVDLLASGMPLTSAQMEGLLRPMSDSLFGSITESLQGFPLPAFAGKSLQPVDFAREGAGVVLFAKLV